MAMRRAPSNTLMIQACLEKAAHESLQGVVEMSNHSTLLLDVINKEALRDNVKEVGWCSHDSHPELWGLENLGSSPVANVHVTWGISYEYRLVISTAEVSLLLSLR